MPKIKLTEAGAVTIREAVVNMAKTEDRCLTGTETDVLKRMDALAHTMASERQLAGQALPRRTR